MRLFLLVLLFVTNLQAQTITLARCPYTGNIDVFTSCLQTNFTDLRKHLSLELERCLNFDSELSLTFQSCVRRNFRTIGQSLALELQICNSAGTQIQRFYIQCVTENFRDIQRAIR